MVTDWVAKLRIKLGPQFGLSRTVQGSRSARRQPSQVPIRSFPTSRARSNNAKCAVWFDAVAGHACDLSLANFDMDKGAGPIPAEHYIKVVTGRAMLLPACTGRLKIGFSQRRRRIAIQCNPSHRQDEQRDEAAGYAPRSWCCVAVGHNYWTDRFATGRFGLQSRTLLDWRQTKSNSHSAPNHASRFKVSKGVNCSAKSSAKNAICRCLWPIATPCSTLGV